MYSQRESQSMTVRYMPTTSQIFKLGKNIPTTLSQITFEDLTEDSLADLLKHERGISVPLVGSIKTGLYAVRHGTLKASEELGDLLTVIYYNAGSQAPKVEIPGKYLGEGNVINTVKIDMLTAAELDALTLLLLRNTGINTENFDKLFYLWSPGVLGATVTNTTRFTFKPA